MKRVLGLDITKKQRVMILIGVPIGVMCLFLYLILTFFEQEPEIPVLLPKGGLSSSIFDSQNQIYKREDAFTAKHSFVNVPYTIDTIEGQKATVGNACIYEHAPYYFYYSETTQGVDVGSVLKEELTSVLLFHADQNLTRVDVLYEEDGFVNGCKANFYVVQITANDNVMQVSRYMTLYRLHLDPSVYETDFEMLVGCLSDNYSTEGLQALQTLSYSSIGSLKLDDKALKRGEDKG